MWFLLANVSAFGFIADGFRGILQGGHFLLPVTQFSNDMEIIKEWDANGVQEVIILLTAADSSYD